MQRAVTGEYQQNDLEPAANDVDHAQEDRLIQIRQKIFGVLLHVT